ncbi:MAG: AAA family ATPase [Demequina sp.]|nr:AAA family ATPase [Demequina sp.]
MQDDRGATAQQAGLEAEQRVVDVLYARLDTLRDEAGERLADVRRGGPSGSPQNRSERDAFATLYEDRIAQLDAVEDRLCFGRLDLVAGDTLYVGRIGLSDAEHAPLLTDWRAPAARAFYSATAANPSGVIKRRHLTTQGRVVTAVEDDVLDVDALEESGLGDTLQGEGALLAALGARRTGRMGDIVATIQAEQDAVIRAPMTGALVVQGGPGTGKTAVALHRAAFLLYQHRALLESRGVLLIGPSQSFLRYIDHVLPSLGETGTVSTTLGGLVRGTDTSAHERDDVAELKGRLAMADVVRAAVRERQRVPRADQEFRIDGRVVVLRRHDVREAQARARRDGKPHNEARQSFAKEMISRLTAQLAEQLGESIDADDRRELERDIREDRNLRIAINLCWLPVTPETLLRDLFSKPHLLGNATRSLEPHERRLLLRSADAPFTDADVPLLDEAAELLGDMPGGGPARPAKPTKEELDYAKEVIASFGAHTMIKVDAETLARRMQGGVSRLSVAERAWADRTWTYGHVVVDEAQELSPMAWRMLLRRCPTRSFTIVGDVAQVGAPAGTRWWPETMDPLFGQSWILRELTISYRIPAAVARAAQAFAAAHSLPASELSAAREVDDSVVIVHDADANTRAASEARRIASDLASTGGGLVAVIADDSRHAALAAAIGNADITLINPLESKGLEFDVVVVVEPAEVAARPGDLYVAMTRPTQQLVLVHALDLPAGIA